ncbi:SMP-30/gluconolactonase/LRE family protein [Gloeobacter morelensis]|uniref:SMP-30/gluconolactonase/LRE family protein n=1 Tax=Gloeobacter morelensis MG652769 TaxID=2781736 RepID=A0ABY3PHU6_9CYAN|nr:SMP-30/gluconolactonase/LRE family protein [Gloeobacter morelensis]UFP93212.1 SMP-30/gluconolactonase/LRE family protein [Gloeobacter morelensis MG652769]
MDTAAPKPEVLVNARARLGEGPCWHEPTRTLYWVDIHNHRVHHCDPTTGENRFFEVGEVVGCLAPAGDYRLILARRHDLVFLDTTDGAVTPILQVEAPRPGVRFNDGKCDAAGRFWFGSADPEGGTGCLYRFDPDRSLHRMETGLFISNGLGWSPDQRTFYLTDTPRQTIYAYDFDLESGRIARRRPWVDLSGMGLFPDGLTVDREGCLWSAMWDGWCVVRFAPDGRERSRLGLPVQRPTCCTFGGADLGTLFITSASVGLSEAQIEKSFHSGDVFCVRGLAVGVPTYSFAGSDNVKAL